MTVSTTERRSKLRWGVEKRLAFIEFRLYWEGRMNRKDLMDQFGVSVNQASTDLNRYIRLAPENMEYNKSRRTYEPTRLFSPLFGDLDADGYLSQLQHVNNQIMSQEDSWIKIYPVYDAVPQGLVRNVDAEMLRFVLEAIRSEQSLQILYQSLSQPEPRWRWMAPHAIVHDNFRWHVRAYCEEDSIYKDFLLARIMDVRDDRDRTCNPEEDRDWHEFVELEIGPNPRLSESQQRVIEGDYGMQGGVAYLRVRRAFRWYTVRRLGLDSDPEFVDPAKQHIVWLNREDIEGPSDDLGPERPIRVSLQSLVEQLEQLGVAGSVEFLKQLGESSAATATRIAEFLVELGESSAADDPATATRIAEFLVELGESSAADDPSNETMAPESVAGGSTTAAKTGSGTSLIDRLRAWVATWAPDEPASD